MGILFNGLLAELPAILDSFSIIPQVIIIIGVVGQGWWSHDSGGPNTCQVVTLLNGPICAVDTTKISQING